MTRFPYTLKEIRKSRIWIFTVIKGTIDHGLQLKISYYNLLFTFLKKFLLLDVFVWSKF